jgi:hypothetical protein
VINKSSGKEREAFLAWISSIDFEKIHQDTFAKKHEKTCDWLMNEPKYQQWFTSPASSLLWCHGKRNHYCMLTLKKCSVDNLQLESVKLCLRK